MILKTSNNKNSHDHKRTRRETKGASTDQLATKAKITRPELAHDFEPRPTTRAGKVPA